MGVRSYLQKQRLFSEDRKLIRQKKIQNLSEINHVFALVSIRSMGEYEKWKNIFKNLSHDRFTFDWISFLTDYQESKQTLPENVFTKNDINLLGFPKKTEFLKGKYSNTYDLSIDLNFENIYMFNWMWVNINSHLRVGSDYKKNMLPFYDFTMSTKDPVNQSKLFIDQVFYFLDQVNK